MMSIYLTEVLAQVPQILSNQDRDPLSPSYGSFDRKYWGWKYKDFSDATLQCAISPLVQIWDLNIPENPYYRHELFFEWITAGVEYLFKIQHTDGSLDQCYPNERAPGNAYELFEPIAIFLERVVGKLSEKRMTVYKDALKRVCDFTLSHDENHGDIANHFALYSYASFKMGRFFNDMRFAEKGEQLLRKTLSLQSSEGWFLEYNGADAGYETRTIYYLAKLATEFSRSDLWEPLTKSLKNFLIYCLHPDGSLGGEYGARNTALCYPAGFEMLSQRLPEAAAIVNLIRKGLEAGRVLSLKSLDLDNLVRLAANYLEAHRYLQPAMTSQFVLPCEEPVLERLLPQAGFYVKVTPSYYFVMNGHKGGGFRVYDKASGALIFNDTSYGALTKWGKVITANLLVSSSQMPLVGGKMQVEASFHHVLQKNMTPLKLIVLRIASLTFLKIGFVSRLFSRFVARVLFTGRKSLSYLLRRNFVFGDDSICVTDVIDSTKGLKEIYMTSFSTSIPMASSKYFGLGDLPALSRPRTSFVLPHDRSWQLLVETKIRRKDGVWSLEQGDNKYHN